MITHNKNLGYVCSKLPKPSPFPLQIRITVNYNQQNNYMYVNGIADIFSRLTMITSFTYIMNFLGSVSERW